MSRELGELSGTIGLAARTTTAEVSALTLTRPPGAAGHGSALPLPDLPPADLPEPCLPPSALSQPPSTTRARDALRRVRAVWAGACAAGALLAVFGAVALRDAEVAAAALGWLAAELLLLFSRHSLRELPRLDRLVKRNLGYAATACVAGVVAGSARPETLRVGAVLCALGLVEVTASRTAAGSWLRRRQPTLTGGVLAVGGPEVVAEVVETLPGRVLVGVCTADTTSADPSVPVVGSLSDVVAVAQKMGVDEVVVGLCGGSVDGEWVRQLGWSLEGLGIGLRVVTGLRGVSASRVRVCDVAGSVYLDVEQRRPSGIVRQAKSVVEAFVAAVLLVVSLPLLVLCMLAVFVDSPGSVLYWQDRVREGGRTFRMVKLRTMQRGAHELHDDLAPLNEVDGALFKIAADPRVTRVGRVLRKLSLDELPQLAHVVTGKMSLVGPRPALPSEVATYDERAERRLTVKPGLTGLWQVSGRCRLTWDESIALDLDYVDNWSAGRDARIAVSTVRAVASREGAY